MTTETNHPAWLYVGAQVAEYNGAGYNGSVVLATVEKITATQAVLDTGRRYRLDGDRRQVGEKPGRWTGRTTLEPLHSVKVRDTVAREQLDRLGYRIDQSRRQLQGGEGAVLELLDEIEREVAATRVRITNLHMRDG